MISVGDKVTIRKDLDICGDYGIADFVYGMTEYLGKTATITRLDPINGLIYIDLDNEDYAWTVFMFEDKELTKYKRVFDILKDTFQLDKSKVSEDKTMYFLILKDYFWEISQEEYELLEEVMKDDN